MGLFKRSVPSHHVAIHQHNAAKKDWVILLEAGTIVGPSPERLRVARATQERKVVRKYNILLRAKHYLIVDGYDPRIHAVYFCPQLYRYDPDKKLVPLQGEEIGRLIAQALESGVTPRRPWYAGSAGDYRLAAERVRHGGSGTSTSAQRFGCWRLIGLLSCSHFVTPRRRDKVIV
jgi:hypothetical protein